METAGPSATGSSDEPEVIISEEEDVSDDEECNGRRKKGKPTRDVRDGLVRETEIMLTR